MDINQAIKEAAEVFITEQSGTSQDSLNDSVIEALKLYVTDKGGTPATNSINDLVNQATAYYFAEQSVSPVPRGNDAVFKATELYLTAKSEYVPKSFNERLLASAGYFIMNGSGGTARTGSSPTLYSFASTRLRPCTETFTIIDSGAASLTHHIDQILMWSPDYEITEPRWWFPNFWQLSAGQEIACAGDIVVDGLAVRIDSGNWVRDDTGYPFTVATTDIGGALTPALNITIPANSKITLRWMWHVSLSGNLAVPQVTGWKNVNLTGVAATSDASRCDTLANAATLKSTYLPADGTVGNGSTLGNGANSVWIPPTCMIAKGGDGRPVMLAMGDSIGGGASAGSVQASYSARGDWGFINIAFDDNSTSKRIVCANFCIAGASPTTWGSSKANYWSKKAAITQKIYDTYGYWPFDRVFNQHGENGVPSLMTGTNLSTNHAQYFTDIRAQWPGLPVIQLEILPHVATTDNYATLANQTPGAGNLYPTGDRWVFNTQCAAGGSVRTGGYIDDSIEVWASVSGDLASDRDLWAVSGLVKTTLAADYASPSNSMSVVAAPPLYSAIKVTGVAGYFHVTAITGTGPYTLTVSRIGVSGSALTGAAVNEVPTGDDVHPSAYFHNTVTLLPKKIIDYKIAQGWV